MGLKLVDNVSELPVYNFQDIAACARRWADQLETGEMGDVSRALVVVETGEGLAICVWGDNVNGYEMVGLLEAAKLHAYEFNVVGDV